MGRRRGPVVGLASLGACGRLIANSDMHTGNLVFQPEAGRLRLAPIHDMLTMSVAQLAPSLAIEVAHEVAHEVAQ